MKRDLVKFTLLAISFQNCSLKAEIDRSWYKTDKEIDDSWNDASARDDRGSASQHAALEKIQARLANFENYSNSDNISYFGTSIRKLAMGNIYQIRERIEVYDNVQTKLISIPGHAEYFGKRIHEAYEPLKGQNPGGSISRAQNEMMYGFATLKNLPSPETVKVLGGMLSETWRMEPVPSEPGDPGYTPPSLALSAIIGALGELPLRMPPKVPIVMAWESSEVVKVHPWQNWYEEVKSGRRTFSFKGQSVEYRFRQDGTWETLPIANRPDDAPKPAVVVANPENPTPPSQKSKPSPPQGPRWAWLIGAAAAVLSALVWLVLRKSTPRAG
jgi:hypothetical protein